MPQWGGGAFAAFAPPSSLARLSRTMRLKLQDIQNAQVGRGGGGGGGETGGGGGDFNHGAVRRTLLKWTQWTLLKAEEEEEVEEKQQQHQQEQHHSDSVHIPYKIRLSCGVHLLEYVLAKVSGAKSNNAYVCRGGFLRKIKVLYIWNEQAPHLNKGSFLMLGPLEARPVPPVAKDYGLKTAPERSKTCKLGPRRRGWFREFLLPPLLLPLRGG
eukprot:9471056-Pyramimonas_sp.AAC.1